MSPRLVLLLALFGCGPSPTPAPDRPAPDTDPACSDTVWFPDTDGDGVGDASRGSSAACEAPQGWVALDGDCNDLDAAVFPGAPEVCDRIDQDCDGTVDEDAVDAVAWHADLDGDGYGDAADVSRACSQPADRVADATDCDDADPDVSPAAWEVCGGVDEDCDGAVDEGDAADAAPFYVDADGDGFGAAGGLVRACEAPAGAVTNPADCDDTDALTSPEAAEVCGGADEDCDGEVDEDDAVDAPAWHADADADGFGDAADAYGACVAPAGRVADATDCDDTDGVVFPGADEHCDGRDDDCDGATDEDDAVDAPTWYADADADGFGDAFAPARACAVPARHVADATDCDDGDSVVFPGAVEHCDGRDDDCDGVTDEDDAADAPTWYADADADGFGDAASFAPACTAPPAHVADATDCDDTDGVVFPGAEEHCDGHDDDCDGTTDEDDAVDAPTWYRDADIDGRGDPDATTAACARPYGYTDDATDCDDTRNGVHPGMAETCATPYDDDCDGDSDDDETPEVFTFFADADGDGYGNLFVSRVACAASDGWVDDASDCDDTRADTYPGAPEIWDDGIDQSCGGDGDGADLGAVAVPLYGTVAGERAGYDVAPDGDPDGDGRMGFVVATPWTRERRGVVYVFSTPPTGPVFLDAADLVIDGTISYDMFGSAVATGDIDGDGVADLAVGVPGAGSHGGALVFRGGRTGRIDVDDADLSYGPETGAGAGTRVAFAGDLDGDGADNLVLGDPDASITGRASAGMLHVYSAPDPDTRAPIGDGLLLRGSTVSGDAGSDVVGPGDLDGDGLDDLVVGDRGWDRTDATNAGAVYVIHGPPAEGDLDAVATFRIEGDAASDDAGRALARAGDADGDGLADFLATTTGTEGYAWLVTAPASGTLSACARASLVVDNPSAVAGGGDLDADGVDDIVVGQAVNPSWWSSYGLAYVLLGSVEGTVELDEDAIVLRGAWTSSAGYSLDLLDNTDGDGHDDLVVGALNDSTMGTQAGAAWFVPGGGL